LKRFDGFWIFRWFAFGSSVKCWRWKNTWHSQIVAKQRNSSSVSFVSQADTRVCYVSKVFVCF
jgi:hypothetical protein